MPRYSGDQIYQNGAYGYNVSPTAQNYRKSAESSNFGTRKLAWYTVWMPTDHGLAANYTDNNSLYYQTIRAIQQGAANIGGANAPSEGNGQILGGGGGGAELFYVGAPQNSSSSPLNQDDDWYNVKPTNTTGNIGVVAASGTGTVATLTFASNQGVAPFNPGDAIEVQGIGDGYDCVLGDKQFVISCTSTQVTYNSLANATLVDLDGYCYADIGLDAFTFAIVDDAEPFLPEGNGYFGQTDYSGVAGDSDCYCSANTEGRSYVCTYPLNLGSVIAQVLNDNDLSTSDFYVYRLQSSFGLLAF